MRFIDEVAIRVRSGAGGRGMVSFHREKHVIRGGPDGGDGGRGGDVVFVADPGLKTLLDFRYRREYEAGNGAPGGRNRKTGRSGQDLVLRVPVGTVISLADGEVLADLTAPGQRAVVARGGKAGLGNSHFALPWRQAPDFAIPPGEPEERELRLELKLLADIGIVGLPNAGKSTLINRISEARARVADYPFTTLVPNLGVVSAGPGRSFVVADMPGLVEGAAEGVGLGLQFLRHCERTRALVHLVDVSASGDPVHALEVVEREIRAHGAGLEDKPVLIAANKMDMPGAGDTAEALREAARARGAQFFAISALQGRGIPPLVHAMASLAFTPDGATESGGSSGPSSASTR